MDEAQEQLIRRAIHGEERAFHELIDLHAGRLYRVAYGLLGNAADAEDVLQETFLAAYRGIGKFAGRASFRGWLIGILTRQAALVIRKRQGKRPGTLDDQVPDRHDEKLKTEMRLDVAARLQELPPEFREVLVLREFEQMSYQQIAETLGVAQGTVESRLFRARQQMKEKLADYRS